MLFVSRGGVMGEGDKNGVEGVQFGLQGGGDE